MLWKRPQEGFLIGAHHGLELSDVDRVCELLIMCHHAMDHPK
jgi:hypothetical protein